MKYIALFLILFTACTKDTVDQRIPVIFDTDANNELDDQHALAYLFSNGDIFNTLGVTVNATRNGGDIHEQNLEAERILQLYNLTGKMPLLKGANANFTEIDSTFNKDDFDGKEAVDFLLQKTREVPNTCIIAVGKLTNIALALKADPSFAERTKIVWLGSNYPEPGEYNQENDTTSMNYVLASSIPFEMVTVRYGKPSGTDAVRATPETIFKTMPSLGPKASKEITGRNGGTFSTFGDYSVNLFTNIDLHGDPPSRALFDMVAVAILKNNSWGARVEIPAPVLINGKWQERPNNTRKITVWENFDQKAILDDFYDRMKNYVLP